LRAVVRGEGAYLVECYSPGVRRDDVEAAAARADAACERLRAEGRFVEYEGAILVPGDEVVLHLFTSDSEASVRQASERAALPFERILETVAIAGGHV
jgi:hypothetical protein